MPASTRPTHRTSTETFPPMAFPRAASLAVVFFVLAMTCATTARAADRIWLKSGGRPTVADAVLEDHYDTVKYKKGAVTLTLEGAKVKVIDYGDAPKSWELARDKRTESEFENAVSLFKAAMAEANVRPWIKLQGAFELAETYRRWGARERARFGDAIRYYDEALAANAMSRLRPDALFGRAIAHLGAGNLDKGLADLDTLATESYANKYGIQWELSAVREKAQALNEAGRAADAKREFSKLETSARGFAGDSTLGEPERQYATEMAGLARLEQGRVLIQENKARDAERFFEQLVNDSNEVDSVRAAALVGKGQALQAQDKNKDAQFAYATVRVQYYSAEEARAEATYRLGLVAEALGSQEPKGSQLSQDYFLEVIQRHPGSRWAVKAQEKLR